MVPQIPVKSFLHSFIKTLDAAFGSLKRRKSKNDEDITESNNLEEHGKILLMKKV